MSSSLTFTKRLAWVLSLLVSASCCVSAQSLDPKFPTPVHRDSIVGRIAARDLGDSRLTDHYYAFRGKPGDLLITVQSRNLNGDIDVFTATTLRPLLKVTLYAESSAPIQKGIYLRRTEELILRVEARSPNDEEGIYQLQFGGSFEAIQGGPDIAENENPITPTPEATTSGRKTKRVSSVGATIEEPAPPVTEVATGSPTPEPTPEPTPVESPSPAAEKPTEPKTTRPTPRSARNRTPASRRTTTTPSKPKESAVKSAPVEEAKNEQPAEVAEPEPKTPPPARSTSRRTRAPARTKPAEPQPEPVPEAGPRLTIETIDGTLINRSMGGVRRITVENGWVVVVGKDGKVERVLLANVVKMSIQP